MTPELAKNIGVLDEPLSCRMVPDQSQMEINLIDRYLDILATAELPLTGEQIPVAIENQYGTADPDHFGRLVGWYMPETGAPMGVLIAEGFDPQLIKAVNDGVIIRPEHGIWLIEACGFSVNGIPVVTYSTVACSLTRSDKIARDRAFRTGAGSSSTSNAETYARAAATFSHIANTSHGWLGPALRKSPLTTGLYRWVEDNGHTCHLELFVGTNRISIGSCYLKSTWDDETLARLVAANEQVTLDPEPTRRYSRGAWWDLRRDLGRDTAVTELPADLGDQIEKAISIIRPALDAHQQSLQDALKEPTS
jgi:hypothetical protein